MNAKDHAIEAADVWFDLTATRLRRGAESIERYKTVFHEQLKSGTPTDWLSYAANELNNITRNLDVASLVRISADLAIALKENEHGHA